ncbi:hypothetical protein MESS4_30025 [Mesorhizobium sp. STM 4661]|nr:hypothetical protein MESS4_30025 [Mesorhizobium sp. STM 4661]
MATRALKVTIREPGVRRNGEKSTDYWQGCGTGRICFNEDGSDGLKDAVSLCTRAGLVGRTCSIVDMALGR